MKLVNNKMHCGIVKKNRFAVRGNFLFCAKEVLTFLEWIKLLVSAVMHFIMQLFLLFRSDNGLMKYISSQQGMND